MKKVIFIAALIAVAISLSACQVGNRMVGLDTTQTFNYAIVQLDNGELIEGEVEAWRDFNESDVVQLRMNGITYLTHYANVILCTEKP